MYTDISINTDNELKRIVSITKLLLKGVAFISMSTVSLARGFPIQQATEDGLYAVLDLMRLKMKYFKLCF
jgi:hypothetical protein